MNIRNSNFKRIALGLTVAATAFGFSAFTSASKFAPVTFGQVSNGSYIKLSSLTGFCNPLQPTPLTPCTITYPSDPGVSSFSYSMKPAGGTESSTKRIYKL